MTELNLRPYGASVGFAGHVCSCCPPPPSAFVTATLQPLGKDRQPRRGESFSAAPQDEIKGAIKMTLLLGE